MSMLAAPLTLARPRPMVSMREALSDPNLLGLALPGDSWRPWRILLIAAMGEALTDDERVVFKQLTGREREPLAPVEEFWGIIGRRGGKTRTMAVWAVYLACLVSYDDVLASGETGVVVFLAASVAQARIAFSYALGIVGAAPLLTSLVVNQNAGTLSLSNRVDLSIRPASFRTSRGVTAVAVLADEAAWWRSDESSANPDAEVLNALRPALATTGGPMIVISSPYARRGELWKAYRRDYGADGDPLVLVAHGASRTLNAALPQRVVDRAMERDPAAASAEYLAEWRTDIEALLTREVVDACVIPGRHELPAARDTTYVAFCDPSGGSADSFTLCVGHAEGDTAVIDAIRERPPPFSPDAVCKEYAAVLASYGLSTVTGDKYAGLWPTERFAAAGIEYLPSDRTCSDYYRDLLPLLNAGRIELPDHGRLHAQLLALERKTSRVGRDTISHPPSGHDDIANAVAGAACLCVDDSMSVQRMLDIYIRAYAD